MAKKTTLTDEEIIQRVEAKAKNSVNWYDSRLSKERTKVLDYYNGDKPKPQHPGSSSYISTDVYDAVEMMKAQLRETFSGGGEDIVTFDPDQEMNSAMCKMMTAACGYVIWRENDGEGFCDEVIHSALMDRNGIAKIFWEERYEYQDEDFSDQLADAVHAIAAQDDVDELEAEEDLETGLYSGTLTRKIDKSKVVLQAVACEEFMIDTLATELKSAAYTAHRTRKTRAELVQDMGYDKDLVARIPVDTTELDLAPEYLARNQQTDAGPVQTDDPATPDTENVTLYESFIRTKLEKGKGVRLYKVCHAGGILLDWAEVNRHPFKAYVPLPVPHSFWGNNFAARVIPTQNARTVLTRSILDHTLTTNNPRWAVVQGGLLNPREMLDNRLGGLVNVKRPDSVLPLPQATLNPFVFEALHMLQEDKEQSTGISSLSQGLNKDAISKQNSQGLVGDLVQLSGQRQKIAARNFAKFLTEVYLEVGQLLIENSAGPKMVEITGQWIEVDPRKWSERKTCSSSMHLGYGEKDRAVAKHVEAYKMLATDPALAPMFTVKNRYNLIRDTMKLAGIRNANEYITPPEQTQPPQPDPMKVKELEIKDKAATASMITAQAHVQKDQRLAALDAQKVALDAADQQFEQTLKTREQDRMDLDVANRVDVSQREMALAEAAPTETENTIISPNG